MKKRLYLVAIALLCFAPLAMAVDLWGGPPPKTEIPEGWNRGDPGSTFQHWDIISPMEWEMIPEFDNPYGVPVAELDDPAG